MRFTALSCYANYSTSVNLVVDVIRNDIYSYILSIMLSVVQTIMRIEVRM